MFGSLGIKAIIAAVLVAAVGGAWLYVRHLSAENAKLTANNAVLASTLESEKAAREEIDRERIRADRLVAESIERGIQRAAANKTIRTEVIHAPAPSQPLAACAPATSLVIGRLQQRTGSEQAGSDPAIPADKPAPVQPGTRSP